MKNRYLSNEEKRACEGLWSEAFFEDSDSFREYYFTEKVKTNRILVAEKDGQILSMIHRNPYQLNIKNQKVICDYLYQARGVKCDPHQIIVGAGNDYLLMMLCSVIGRNHVIAVENPAYKQAYRLFSSQSYPVEPIEMDRYGMRVDMLRESVADIAYVTPSHQYPTGIVMPMKRRIELLGWANESEKRYIIEDDYDSEFRYKGKPIPALQGSDANGKVIYLGTFSKSIAPSLRISYMVLPQQLIERYRTVCGFYSTTVPRMQQEILREFLRDGHFERHLNKMRGIYRGRHDFLIGELKKRSWVLSVSGDHAGLHVLVEADTGCSEREICERAAAQGVKVSGLGEYALTKDGGGGRNHPVLLLGYGSLTEQEIQMGLTVLDSILDAQESG